MRVPKQNTEAALMSCLLEEDDVVIEEDEDAITEIGPSETVGDMTLGGLLNVVPAADSVDDQEDYVIVKLKGAAEWTLLPASSIGGGGTGVQRNVLIQNDLDSRNISASKGEPCYLNFTFISQERYGMGGDYENTVSAVLCQISIKNAVNAEFTVVKQMYIQSGYSNTVDVADLLSSGSNQIMIKVTGEITEMTTPSFVYTVQLTSLSIAADNFRWWTAFSGDITIPLNIGGNISRRYTSPLPETGITRVMMLRWGQLYIQKLLITINLCIRVNQVCSKYLCMWPTVTAVSDTYNLL